ERQQRDRLWRRREFRGRHRPRWNGRRAAAMVRSVPDPGGARRGAGLTTHDGAVTQTTFALAIRFSCDLSRNIGPEIRYDSAIWLLPPIRFHSRIHLPARSIRALLSRRSNTRNSNVMG